MSYGSPNRSYGSPSRKYYSPLKVESEQKDIVIASLKAENFELKQKERDYNSLHSQLLELEHRYNLLRDEKFLDERDSRTKEDIQLSTIDNLKVETNVLRRSLDEKQGFNRELNSECVAYKDILDRKNRDIALLKGELAEEMDNARRNLGDKKQVEEELSMTRETKFLTGEELKEAELSNSRLNNIRSDNMSLIRERDLDVNRMERKNMEATDEILLLQKEKKGLETELDIARDGRRANQLEVDRMLVLNQKLMEENKDRDSIIANIDYDIKRQGKRDADQGFLLDAKERQLRDARQAINYAEDIGKESKTSLAKVLREKETLQHVAEMNKKDALINNKLRREEMEMNLQLSAEKKRLERNLLDREVETYGLQKEIGKQNALKGNLYDENASLENEVNALKSHTGLLMSQNKELGRELDRVVDISESIRPALNVKPRLEGMKRDQDVELSRSMVKVAKSSPARTGKSPYKSPGKY